jgi:hypothetical protein
VEDVLMFVVRIIYGKLRKLDQWYEQCELLHSKMKDLVVFLFKDDRRIPFCRL